MSDEQRNEGSELNALGSILAGEPETVEPELEPIAEEQEPGTDEPAPESSEESEAPPETEQGPTTFKQLAEKLDVAPKELYATEVMPGVTIGDMKDAYKNHSELETSQNTLDTRRVEFDTEMAQRGQEIASIASIIGTDHITPQQKQEIQRLTSQNAQRETQLLLQTTPEWRDAAVAESDRGDMLDWAAGFGLTEADMAGIQDHRWVRALRTAALSSKRAKTALEGIKKNPPKAQRVAKAGFKRSDGGSGIVEQHKAGKISERDALAAVLLSSGSR
jgi:hypothetical protein